MTDHLRPTAPIAPAAVLPGDPGRALALAQDLLESPRMANHARGLWGYIGAHARGRRAHGAVDGYRRAQRRDRADGARLPRRPPGDPGGNLHGAGRRQSRPGTSCVATSALSPGAEIPAEADPRLTSALGDGEPALQPVAGRWHRPATTTPRPSGGGKPGFGPGRAWWISAPPPYSKPGLELGLRSPASWSWPATRRGSSATMRSRPHRSSWDGLPQPLSSAEERAWARSAATSSPSSSSRSSISSMRPDSERSRRSIRSSRPRPARPRRSSRCAEPAPRAHRPRGHARAPG